MSTKSHEVSALHRITPIIASGGKVDVTPFIGNHECRSSPPSLFDNDGRMRFTCSNAILIKAILEQTNLHTLQKLSQSNVKTDVVIIILCIRLESCHFFPMRTLLMCLTYS